MVRQCPEYRFLSLALVFAALLLACNRQNQNSEVDQYLEKEIRSRLSVLAQLPDSAGRIKKVCAIGEEVDKVILLSKDIENLQAAVQSGNRLFRDLAAEYGMSQADFTMLSADMHINDMASFLKQNELSFLNQYLMLHSKTQVPLFTAH